MSKAKEINIQINNLTIGYHSNEKPILENINLEADVGCLIALIGVNGSGKSTLLKTILRLQNKLSGQIKISGKNIEEYSIAKLARTISYVSTEIINIQNLSVYNLVALGRFPYTNWLGKLSEEDKSIVIQSLEMVGMLSHKSKNINEISDGERQRVLIARTLAQDTPIILLDEPSSFLDLANKFETINLLHRLSREKNKTIIFSSHDLNIALQEADLFWIINNDVITRGIPEDLVLDGTFNRIFSHSKLDFNLINGEFAITKEKIKKIALKGNGETYFWTKKALERNAYNVLKPSFEKFSGIEILNSNNLFSWKYDNIEFENIEKLLIYLKLHDTRKK